MDFLKRNWREVILAILIAANISVIFAYAQRKSSDLLRVYYFDIGQGDSIFIDSPSHGRALIDGGPNRAVLSELGKVMPFYDKRIDVVIETHPDKDHIG
jgi:competence protein ComEC